eukprot:jgi/Galph1/2094/GphlegSOOS_G751.1
MKSSHHSETLSLSKHSRNSFESNEWKKIILESLEYEKSLLQQIQLHSMDLASSLVVGIVCKGCWKSEGMSWSEIIDEAEKFLIPIRDQYCRNL